MTEPTAFFKPGDPVWFWGKCWSVTAVRPDPRCGYVVDLEREMIPAGTAVLLVEGRVVSEAVEVPAEMGRRFDVPQTAVLADWYGQPMMTVGRAYISGWLGWTLPKAE